MNEHAALGEDGEEHGSRCRELERDDFSSNRHLALLYCWSMIFSENRCPLFGIMLRTSEEAMSRKPIEYADAAPAVRAVFDDIKRTRNVPDVNNFWKYLAHDPVTLRRTWESVKEVMGPGALDPVVKEMIYVAVSVTNGCGYCIASHSMAARNAGMTEAMFGELMAVVGMANETNQIGRAHV